MSFVKTSFKENSSDKASDLKYMATKLRPASTAAYGDTFISIGQTRFKHFVSSLKGCKVDLDCLQKSVCSHNISEKQKKPTNPHALTEKMKSFDPSKIFISPKQK